MRGDSLESVRSVCIQFDGLNGFVLRKEERTDGGLRAEIYSSDPRFWGILETS